MIENILKKLVNNSKVAIDDGVYEISDNLENSGSDLIRTINTNVHASLITEVKFSSPSLGKIRTISDPVDIAKKMIAGGTSALSVLTQPHLFNGSPEFFMKIRRQVQIPMLMKDIMIDKVQIDAAQKIGADYILLIQSLFDTGLLQNIDDFINYAHGKNLKVLLESHTKKEFENSLKTSADILGINNRNLDTLELDINTTKEILNGQDVSQIIISESGINTPQDIQFLHKCGAKAFLVGTSIMKSDNIEENVRNLVNAI